ncbi:MAG: transporter [Terriglobia bacterium]
MLFFALAAPGVACAQENYEIQVYGYETVPAHHTMLEFHTNFTPLGEKKTVDGVLPTHHAWHETIEITHGFNDWFETGFYIFTSARSGNGWDFVGSHIRPRVRVPESWHWPLGVSLSNEIGYQRRNYSEDTWTWEMRPIIDKQWGKWYGSFNPTLERALHGANTRKGFEFSPNFKVSYDVTRKVAAGIEYYGSLGPISCFDPLREQQHAIFPTLDLNLGPQWEVNFGPGFGLTSSTDRLILKLIIGYRFDF